MKTGIAVSAATGLMSIFDPTHGLVCAGANAALMIAPTEHVGKEWARNQFMSAFLGAQTGAILGRFFGWAPLLSGVAVMLLIMLYAQIGYTGAIMGGVTNLLFILEHTDKGNTYAFFRFAGSVAGLVIGWLVNRYVFPYQAPSTHDERPTAED